MGRGSRRGHKDDTEGKGHGRHRRRGHTVKAVCSGVLCSLTLTVFSPCCQAVAVKVFCLKTAEMNGISPNQLVRQEVSILSQLDHPDIIRLVGMCLHPKPLLVLEYAHFSSL